MPLDHKSLDARVSESLDQARVAAGLTFKQLADRIGVSAFQVSKYCRGMDRLSAGRLVVIAHALGVAPDHLMRGALVEVHGSLAKAAAEKLVFNDADEFNAARRAVTFSTATLRRIRELAGTEGVNFDDLEKAAARRFGLMRGAKAGG